MGLCINRNSSFMKCSASCCLWNENVTYSRDTKLPSLEGRILAIKHFLIVRLFILYCYLGFWGGKFLFWYVLLILKLSAEVADDQEMSRGISDITDLYLNLIVGFSLLIYCFQPTSTAVWHSYLQVPLNYTYLNVLFF